MGETDKLVRFEEETSPSKFIALIGVLFMIFEAIAFFYASDPETIFILYRSPLYSFTHHTVYLGFPISTRNEVS